MVYRYASGRTNGETWCADYQNVYPPPRRAVNGEEESVINVSTLITQPLVGITVYLGDLLL
jgi:hypothetical protein